MTNKLTVAIAAALICAPFTIPKNAYAVNATYRAQLERSGCTQVTEAEGTCDVNKTKDENAKTAKLKDDAHTAQLRAMGEEMLGTKAEEAAAILKANGFLQTDPGIWFNPNTNDVIKTSIRDGVISTTTINK